MHLSCTTVRIRDDLVALNNYRYKVDTYYFYDIIYEIFLSIYTFITQGKVNYAI